MRTRNRGVESGAFAGLLCAVAAFASPDKSIPISSGWLLQDAARVPQSGEVISSTSFQPAGWHRATVPGTVLTSLVNDGTYPEPLYGENNRPDRIPDTLCRTTWWYRTVFAPPAAGAGSRIWLNFDGINYLAEVWLNGHEVGTIKGAFTRGIFDVTSYLVAGASNALAVHILPQPHPGETHEKTIANGTGPNGGVTGLDGPTFLCTIGWDWIPTIRDRDSGIWQEVTLSASGPVVLEDPFVTSDLPLPRTDTADLTVAQRHRRAADRHPCRQGRGYRLQAGRLPWTERSADHHANPSNDPLASPQEAPSLVAQWFRAGQSLHASPCVYGQGRRFGCARCHLRRAQDQLFACRLR
jgi:hypothetical protein